MEKMGFPTKKKSNQLMIINYYGKKKKKRKILSTSFNIVTEHSFNYIVCTNLQILSSSIFLWEKFIS